MAPTQAVQEKADDFYENIEAYVQKAPAASACSTTKEVEEGPPLPPPPYPPPEDEVIYSLAVVS